MSSIRFYLYLSLGSPWKHQEANTEICQPVWPVFLFVICLTMCVAGAKLQFYCYMSGFASCASECVLQCVCCCACVYKCQRHVFSMPHLSTNTPAAINYAKSSVRSVGQTLLEIRSWLRGVGERERERHVGRSSGKWQQQQQTAGGAVNAVVILHWPRPILPPSRPGLCLGRQAGRLN